MSQSGVNEDLERGFEEFESGILWIRAHFEELKKQYPDQLIAVREGKVIAHSSDLNSLLDMLDPYGDETSHMAIKFIPSQPLNMVL